MRTSQRSGIVEISVAEAISAVGAPGGLDELLRPGGALLLRSAEVTSPAALAGLARALGLEACRQVEPFAPRQDLGDGVWSHPSWPSTSPMCMHHELGWQREPPQYFLVACRHPPASGGRTGVADGRDVLAGLPELVVERAAVGWTLVRRYRGGLVGMSWPEAFCGMDRAAVERYAAAEGAQLTWGADGLVTTRTRPAIVPTGPDGVPAWSNLLAFCSEWTLDPAVRSYLLSVPGDDGLPFETCYGDGEEFTADDVRAVVGAYDRVTRYVDWRAGDVLVLDNVRTAHSMEPYTGRREMAVLHARRRGLMPTPGCGTDGSGRSGR